MTAEIVGDSGSPGQHLLRLSWLSTVVLAAVVAAGLVSADGFIPFVVALSVAMFLLGSLLLLLGLLYGLKRSRVEIVTVFGLFFLQDSAPSTVRRVFAGSMAFQFVIAFTAAAMRPYTEMAFVILAPMLPLGSAALWSSQHGFFPRRANGPS